MTIDTQNCYPSLFAFTQSICQSVIEPTQCLIRETFPSQGQVITPPWQSIVVRKINDSGEVICFRNKENVLTNEAARFRYTLHTSSSELYVSESKDTVWVKCALIAIVSQTVMTAVALWHVARLITDAVSSVFLLLRGEGGLMDRLQRSCQMLSKSLKENLFKIAAAPIAFLGMKIGALIGLISPFTGRRIVARVESLYNFGRSMKESMCSFEDLFSSAGKYSRPDVFYLAQCFQRRSDLRRCIIDETAPA